MAYTPTIWQDGDIITSEGLNKLEQGVNGLNSLEQRTTDVEDAVEAITPTFSISNGVVTVVLPPATS